MKDNDGEEEDKAQERGTEDGVMKESSCRAASIILIHFTRVLQQVQDLPDGSVSVTHLFSKPLLFNSSV